MRATGIRLGVWGIAMLLGSLAAGQNTDKSPEYLQRAAAPDAVSDLLYSRPFTLTEAYAYTWLRGQPLINSGHILVLAVDPEVARPRQVDVPVLYAGDTPAHLTNTGFPSGHMIVIVPEWIDLHTVPVYFGSTELPERIDRVRGQGEMQAARARGAKPFTPDQLAVASAMGGDTLAVADPVALMRAVADLIEIYAPEEHELAEIYRTPLVSE
jgi:hypothetical protein